MQNAFYANMHASVHPLIKILITSYMAGNRRHSHITHGVMHPIGHYNFISVAAAHSTIISILYNNSHARNNLSSRFEQRV